MSEQVLILSADPWEFADEKTGELRSGLSLWFVSKYRDGDNGFKPSKVSCARELYESIKGKLPCLGVLDCRTRPGKGGKAELIVAGVKIGKPVDLEKL